MILKTRSGLKLILWLRRFARNWVSLPELYLSFS